MQQSRTCGDRLLGKVFTVCAQAFIEMHAGKAEGVPEGMPSCKIAAPGSAFDYVFVILHCRAVDFGAGWWAPESAFGQQKALNAPGKSPPFCSEF